MNAIDLRGWTIDERFSPYPEGSRDKYAVIAPADHLIPAIVPSHRYLLKFSNPRYPVQFWSELIADVVAKVMGIKCPDTFYAEDPSTGQPGSLISWFYGEHVEDDNYPAAIPDIVEPMDDIPSPDEAPERHSLYIPGSSYMARRIPNYDMKKGSQHNLTTLRIFLTGLRRQFQLDFWPHWICVFAFDAIIGNTDRHQDNWGVLWRRAGEGALSPRFSPAFDNGTSLLHEITEENLERFSDEGFMDRYINRGTSHIKINKDDKKRPTHLQLISQILEYRPDLQDILRKSLSFEADLIKSALGMFCAFDCRVMLSSHRAHVIQNVIERRRVLLLDGLFL